MFATSIPGLLLVRTELSRLSEWILQGLRFVEGRSPLWGAERIEPFSIFLCSGGKLE